MNLFPEYIRLLYFTLPVFTGVGCIVLILFSFGDSMTRTEVEVKRTAVLYLCCGAFAWLVTFLYAYFPEIFLPLNILTYLAFLYTQILFYRLFHILTRLDEQDRFSRWHYLLPALISAALLIWSLFVPYDIQLEIVRGRGTVIPEGYEAYSRFFLSKPPVRFLFSIVYITLTFVRLYRYFRRINNRPNLVRRPAGWVIFLAAMTLTSILSSAIGTFIPRTIAFSSGFPFVASLAIFFQHILLTYHIIRRQYMLYITFPGREHKPLRRNAVRRAGRVQAHGAAETDTAYRRTYGMDFPQADTGAAVPEVPQKQRKPYTKVAGTLTRKSFEGYMDTHKPFLDPRFTITTLADAMNINRSYLSGFVNRTYGVNFNRYINRLRLRELDRLMNLPFNAGKTERNLAHAAGFSDYKHYSRTLRAEHAENETEQENKKPEKQTED